MPLASFARIVGKVVDQSRISEVPSSGARRSGVDSPPLVAAIQRNHAVQFYEDEAFLFEAVGRYFEAGLENGERLLCIARSEHADGILRQLVEVGGMAAIESGQLTLVDAEELLAKFMVEGQPDPDRFRHELTQLFRSVRGPEYPRARVRAYGEMVDVLWRSGNANAAVRLEELWNEAQSEYSFDLLCAYLMGDFEKKGDRSRFVDVCEAHTHVAPTETFSLLDGEARLREITILQQRAQALEGEIERREQVENDLRDALRNRSRVEEELRSSLEREKQARAQAEASDAFKEVFIGILGHDLRNPLNTVLTTARLMVMRGELPAESQKRLERVVASGVRMERMIAQLLDLARARLAGGIPIFVGESEDVAARVSRVLVEIRVAHPAREIQFTAISPCFGRVDGDRFEQVVSNLLDNAIAHGDPSKPIRVDLREEGESVCLSVQNEGSVIPSELMPVLFDPFKRGQIADSERTGGLGLGLYIADRIVSAHGGSIDVESSADQGTRFDVFFPRHHE